MRAQVYPSRFEDLESRNEKGGMEMAEEREKERKRGVC